MQARPSLVAAWAHEQTQALQEMLVAAPQDSRTTALLSYRLEVGGTLSTLTPAPAAATLLSCCLEAGSPSSKNCTLLQAVADAHPQMTHDVDAVYGAVGSRACPGRLLAVLELKVAVARLVAKLKFGRPDPDAEGPTVRAYGMVQQCLKNKISISQRT